MWVYYQQKYGFGARKTINKHCQTCGNSEKYQKISQKEITIVYSMVTQVKKFPTSNWTDIDEAQDTLYSGKVS